MSTKYLRPTNGVSFGTKYTVTADDVDTAAVAEIVTLAVTAACSSNGNVGVTLPALTIVNIAVTTADNTPTAVATAVRAGTFTGWTTGGTGTSVTFTKNVAGAVTGSPVLTPNATGVTGTITISTPGADAYNGHVSFDFRQGSSFRYPLTAVVQVLNASNVVTMPADLAITFPSNGVIDVDGTLVEDSIIALIAQRASVES
jgi:hypothetical protein